MCALLLPLGHGAAAGPHPAAGAERGYGTAEPPALLSHLLLRTQNCVRCSRPTLYLDVKGYKSGLPISAQLQLWKSFLPRNCAGDLFFSSFYKKEDVKTIYILVPALYYFFGLML